MREQKSIPASKVERSAKLINTGIKVGFNYLKHYSKRLVDPNLQRDGLDRENAEDIYKTLSELKGSALKVAQMLSIDRNVLPKEYADIFSLSQYNAPPLSGPLIVRTFTRHFGKPPQEIFDSFNLKAAAAASIGQVHAATLNNKKLAVKIQYPGVGESISSDLKMVKPFALRLIDVDGKDLDLYMREVEERVLEETDYQLELERSIYFSAICRRLPNVVFPSYYPDLSSKRVITMDWMDGLHLREFLLTNPTQRSRNRVGQALWDFYSFQQHELRSVHADPHPGNFLITPEGKVGIIDFGCIKEMPEEFYYPFFNLAQKDVLEDRPKAFQLFAKLGMILPDDTLERELYFGHFKEMISLVARPFVESTFDFGQESYFRTLFAYGDRVARLPEFKRPRGSKHFIYVNRTNFGLYNILHQLRAKVRTDTYPPKLQPVAEHVPDPLAF
jgi:predicted unusual protein kinase regulating ubiquinone biosynthesis (AarF/ABC1/UbiB family)